MSDSKDIDLHDIVPKKHLVHVLNKFVGDESWTLIKSDVRPASVSGLAGFLGDHFIIKLTVKVGGSLKTLQIFVKTKPLTNKPKRDYIDDGKYFDREMMMYNIFEEMDGAEGPNAWRPKAYLCTEDILIMPDLTLNGYSNYPSNPFDLSHVLLTAASLGRFHAAFVNYETKKSINLQRPYNSLEDYQGVMEETTFKDTPWLQEAANISADLLKRFTTKKHYNIPELGDRFAKLFVKACDSMKDYKDTLNVIIHKDLWINNVMFRHDKGQLVNALLIDFQCVRYSPPAFDLLIFIYLCTSRIFREQYEPDILKHYFKIFYENLNVQSLERLRDLNYDFVEFSHWCESSRMFGMVTAMAIFPFVLMDGVSARRVFDNPETYVRVINKDRASVVVEHAATNDLYKEVQVEIAEEFVDRFVLNNM